MLLVGGTGLVAWGEQTIPTGIAALLIALVPMWLAIFGFALYRESVPPLVGAGIVVGLVGVAILAWPAGDVGSLDPAGLLALMVSPVFWTLGTLYATRRCGPARARAARERHPDARRRARVRRSSRR